jgi:hypothetical protein
MPQATSDAAERAAVIARQSRRTAILLGSLTVAILLLIGWQANTSLPASSADVDRFLVRLHGKSADASPALPSPAEYAANWPRFLGPTANAFVSDATLPLALDLASGRHSGSGPCLSRLQLSHHLEQRVSCRAATPPTAACSAST